MHAYRHIVPGWVTSSENVVELSEDGGWVHTETEESVTRLALLRTLSALSRVKVCTGLHGGMLGYWCSTREGAGIAFLMGT